MKKLAVIMDTWTTMYEDQKNGNDIFLVSLMIFEEINGKVTEYQDYVDISQMDILEKLEKKAKLSTSQPNIGNSMRKLNAILQEYEKVLIIPMPKKLSGTFAGWETIVNELSKEDANRVVIKDFYDISIASYDSVLEALELYKDEVDPINLVINNLTERMNNIFACFIAGDVNQLIRSGRVSFLKGLLAVVLKKKITIGWDGSFKKLAVSSKIKKNLEISLKVADEQISFIKKGIKKLYISRVIGAKNPNFDDYSNFIKDYLKMKKVQIDKTIIMDVTNTVVTHLGAMTLGFYIETK